MNKVEFIKQLKATANELKLLAESVAPGALTWNGTEYVKGIERKADPYALAWFSTLLTIADLIEAQEAPLSDKQIAYLKRNLFGGMGSLNDLSFDSRTVGDLAKTINDRLDKQRRLLYISFKDD